MLVAVGAAAVLRFGPLGALEVGQPDSSAPWLVAPPIWIGAMTAFGLYSPSRCANAVEEARRVAGAGFAAPVVLVMLSFAFKADPSRLWVGASALFAIATVGIGRRGLRWIGVLLRRRGRWMTPAIVVGHNEAKRLIDLVVGDPAGGYEPVATCGFVWNGLPSGEVVEIDRLVEQSKAGAVLVVSEDLERDEVRHAVAVADNYPTSVIVLSGLDYTLVHNLQVVSVGRQPGLALEAPALRTYQRFVKRGFDSAVSLIGLVVALPVVGLIALAVKLDSSGPVLFRQLRMGMGGRTFSVFKFRTMIEGAEDKRDELSISNEADGILFKVQEDPRRTRIGRFLRRWSLDELPQILNVLRGDMSLVGPRPLPIGDYNLPGEELALRRRLHVRPGLTGLWQISGRSNLGSDELLRLDITYVQNWSFLLDLYVLLRTIPAVISGRGAT